MNTPLLSLAASLLLVAPSFAQSLNERSGGTAAPSAQPAAAPATTSSGSNGNATASASTRNDQMPQPPAALRGVSLFLVTPPPPKTFSKNDLVEIIINETSNQKSEQTLDTKKDYNTAAELTRFPSLRHLLEAQLRDGDTTPIVGVEASSNNKFKGDGEYERKDKFSARITAMVVEVKPNGTLVLEARKQVNTNKEETTLVLAGLARPEDITSNNTVQSSQLANLTLTVKNEGDVKNTATKGIIPQILDTIFNF